MSDTSSPATGVAQPPDRSSSAGPRVPAARNTIATLRLLAAGTGPLGAGDIARALGIPRSSTYQLLQVLVDEGVVLHLPDQHAYTLGIGVFEFGSAYLRNDPLERIARPLLSGLAQRTGATAQLGILEGTETLYLLKEQRTRRPTPLVTGVGVRLPAHLTASGRSMLALLPDAEVETAFCDPGSFSDRTGLGPRSTVELLQLLRGDRRLGYAVEQGAVTSGVTCVAAAAADRRGRPVASITVSFPTADVPGNSIAAVAGTVVQTALSLSKRLGGGRP